jgi:DNA-directed RNA polymerase specialized sigma subunit
MPELKELIAKAKQKDVEAMEELFNKFKPLLKSRAKRYSRIGLEYDDVFQQGVLLFIIGVYEHQAEKERSPTAFSSYIKKRLDWGLWMYYRKFLKQQVEMSSGLKPKEV